MTRLRMDLQSAPLQQAYRRQNMRAEARDLRREFPEKTNRYGSLEAFSATLEDALTSIAVVGIQDAELRARCLMMAVVMTETKWPAFRQSALWRRMELSPENAEDQFRDHCAMIRFLHADLAWW